MLQGFKKFDLSIGPISVSITNNGLNFSKTAVVRMNKCSYVTFHIDEDGQRIAIQEATKDEESAVKFFDEKKKAIAVRWNNQDLLNTISRMMGWDLSMESYKALGEFLPEEKAIIFDLTKSTSMSSNLKE